MLFHGGFRGDHLIETANSSTVKEQLRLNTKRCDNHDHVILMITNYIVHTAGQLIMEYVEYRASKSMIIKQ